MKKVLSIIVMMICFVMFSGSVMAQSTLGYVDLQKVFTSYEKTKAAQADIKEKELKLQNILEEKQKEIEKAKEDKVSEEKIKEMIEGFESDLEPKRKELLELREKLTVEIQNDIIKATKNSAKELGIDVVLDKQVFITGGIDLTNLVIEKLNL